MRRDAETGRIHGSAFLYETASDNLPFIEVIERGAINEAFLKEQKVLALLNHDYRDVLAVWDKGERGSLELSAVETGLDYDFPNLESDLGKRLGEYISRGDIVSSSFCFDMDGGLDEWSKTEDGKLVRTIKKFGHIYDVSPVFFAAYSATECYSRSAFENAKKALETPAHVEIPDEYYDTMKSLF